MKNCLHDDSIGFKFCKDCGRKIEQKERVVVVPMDNIDWTALLALCKDYVDYSISDDYHEDNDYKHYIFETALETIYGEDVFKKLNQ